jgi:NitT/TauT family transport system ATP-binding protein
MADAETPRANSLAELLKRGPDLPRQPNVGATPPAADEVQEPPPAAPVEPAPPAEGTAAAAVAPAADAGSPADGTTIPAGAAPPLDAPVPPAESRAVGEAAPAETAAGSAESMAAGESEGEAAPEEESPTAPVSEAPAVAPEVRSGEEPVHAGAVPIVPPPVRDRPAPTGPAHSVAERRELLSQRLDAARTAAVQKVAAHGHADEVASPEPPVWEPVDDLDAEPPDERVYETEDDVPDPDEFLAGMPGDSQPVINIERLSLTFQTRDGPVDALSEIDLTVEPGEFVSLIGPSGCGKTTLLRVIADLEKPTGGTILINGESAEQARRNRAYGYVFQAPALYPWRNVARNVALPLEVMGLGVIEREGRIARNLDLVNLTGFERKYPWQLSGGMQQRVSIARALAVEPDLLLMDEPFGALDEIVRDHLNEQLLDLWAKTSRTVVFVTHSIPEAVFLSTRIVVMTPRPGKIYDIIDSDLPLDRDLDIRETPEFLKIAHRVREGLKAGHSYED